MGDCAITGNVPSMRNPMTGWKRFSIALYLKTQPYRSRFRGMGKVPKLPKTVRPIHEFVKVDVYPPGCPPSADTFHTALTALITGEPLDIPALAIARA